ncbi:hypothetical protein M9458_052292 [Cirrhinus mrigala]|uniref:Uncharacterized protein n=1 Tax=Cirrhinus mrigala TaxID=683832 RepID=A0ABD0MRG2_CIRMR
MASDATITPETRAVSVTPQRNSVEMGEDTHMESHGLTKILRKDEDFVKDDFTVSDERVGRFVFDKTLQIVKLYVLDYLEDYTPECSYLLLTAIDWPYFYNQIWREFNSGKMRYFYQWDAVTPGMRYRATKQPAYISISSCWNKTFHDQNFLMLVSKPREESESESESETSSDESDSDEYDSDWPIPEDNPFGCCKTNLYFDQSDVPVLNTIFSTIDELFQSS